MNNAVAENPLTLAGLVDRRGQRIIVDGMVCAEFIRLG